MSKLDARSRAEVAAWAVTHRLNHYRAGLRMDYTTTTADDLATTMRAALAEAGTRPGCPAYEAIQNVGEAEFHRAAVEQAQRQLRDGLPLRASINVVGYLARKPGGAEHA